MKEKFLTIECPECGHRQRIYVKPSILVHCNACGHKLAEPTGGIGKFNGRIAK